MRSVNDSGYSEWSDPFQFQTILATVSGKSELPLTYELDQNYPNPFIPATKIQYALPEPSHVRLDVYNALGQRVATLINENKSPGRHEVTFDAANLSSGLYLYRIQTEGYVETKPMLLVK